MGAASPGRTPRPPSHETSLLELRWQVDSEGYILERDMERMTPADRLKLILSVPRGVRSETFKYKGNVFSTLADVLNTDLANDEMTHEHVVPLGGRSKPYTCKGDDLGILIDLWNMPDTPEGVLGFVNLWGLLAGPSEEKIWRVSAFILYRDGLDRFWRNKRLPRTAGDAVFATMKLVGGPTRQPCFRADTLGGFLWAQVLQVRHGAVFQCRVCKKFAWGPRAPKTDPPRLGRPAEFCTNACRSKANRQRIKARARES